MKNSDRTEEEHLDRVAEAIALAFEDPDPWIRMIMTREILGLKWSRVAALQGWR